MADNLNNPMRFSVTNRIENIGEILGNRRSVTKMEVVNGQIYIHWEVRQVDPGHPLTEDDGE